MPQTRSRKARRAGGGRPDKKISYAELDKIRMKRRRAEPKTAVLGAAAPAPVLSNVVIKNATDGAEKKHGDGIEQQKQAAARAMAVEQPQKQKKPTSVVDMLKGMELDDTDRLIAPKLSDLMPDADIKAQVRTYRSKQ